METFYILARQNGNAIQYVEVTKTGKTDDSNNQFN